MLRFFETISGSVGLIQNDAETTQEDSPEDHRPQCYCLFDMYLQWSILQRAAQ